jgi:hypothetical protein
MSGIGDNLLIKFGRGVIISYHQYLKRNRNLPSLLKLQVLVIRKYHDFTGVEYGKTDGHDVFH